MPNSSSPLLDTDSALAQLAGWLRAAGDPLRLVILRLLERDAFGVLELCFLLDSKQPSLSHHLKILLHAGLVTTRRERTTVFYRRDPSGAEAGSLKRRLMAELDEGHLPHDVMQRLKVVREQRAQASQRFFTENATRFRSQQEQIADFSEYGPLAAERAIRVPGELLLEIGPGEGDLLPMVSPHFQRILAIDASREMLDKAQSMVRDQHLGNVELRHADLLQQPVAAMANTVVMNMVLHHVPQPEALIASACEHLANDGRLIITELCEHDQDWVRDACGDAWLGFPAEDLLHWTRRAGVLPVSADYLALRNGFRVQIHEFQKPAAALRGTTR